MLKVYHNESGSPASGVGPVFVVEEAVEIVAAYVISAGSIQLQRYDDVATTYIDVTGAPAVTANTDVTHNLIGGRYRYNATSVGAGNHVYIDGPRVRFS